MTSRRRSELGLEITTEVEQLFNLETGEKVIGVRVRYRAEGVRRWQHFLIWPDEGQTLEQLIELAGEAADRVHAGKIIDAAARLLTP